jgi:uncharacterized repeat protein (TIGR03847 family)
MAQGNTLSAHLWLEKQQLQALADAIGRMLVEIDNEQGLAIPSRTEAISNPKPPGFPAIPDVDMQVVALGLRYDPDYDLIALEAYEHDTDEENDEPPTFRCLGTRAQMEALQLNAVEVVSAGRPRCPFCGTPLSQAGLPHFCPPMNGHQKPNADD